MGMQRALIGRSWKSDEVYEVSREKIRDYALAIGEDNPVYFREEVAHEAGYPTVIAPPTFATMLWFRMGAWPLRGEPELNRPKEPIFLMGEQSVTHHRPIQLGDRLLFGTTLRDIRAAGPHELFEVGHDISTVQGEPVCSIVDVMVARGAGISEEDAR